DKPLLLADRRKYLERVLLPLCEVYPNPPVYFRALEIQERWRSSLYDTLIIASAQDAECSLLYSEDLQHEQKIHELTIVNPFM
ncbi:MAG: PIN domain-containing protein, partial [Pyrinomonadaceae bacterium]